MDPKKNVRADVVARCQSRALMHHGVISLEEAKAFGLSADALHRLLHLGRWKRLLPGIYGLPVPPDDLQRVAAAAKWGGERAAICRQTAATILRLEGIPKSPEVHLAVPNAMRRPAEDIKLHQSTRLDGFHVVEVEGIRCTSATRTLFDVAADLPFRSLEIAAHDALRRRLTSLARLRWISATDGRRGRRGTAAFRRLLDAITPTEGSMESPLEERLFYVLKCTQLPLPQPQYSVVDKGSLVARVDFAYPAAKVAIEADGYRWHSERAAWERDRERITRLSLLGWKVVHVTHLDLVTRPDQVVAWVADALGARLPT